MSEYPLYSTKVIYCACEKDSIGNRLNGLNKRLFDVIQVANLADAYEKSFDYLDCCIIVSEGSEFYHNKSRASSLIIVTKDALDLREEQYTMIPKSMFLSSYLEEFILWSVQKDLIYNQRVRQERKVERMTQIVRELAKPILRGASRNDG